MNNGIERDVLEVYPGRELECTKGDLEMAISILEGILEKPELMVRTLTAHLVIDDAKEMYAKTFMLAAESMKGNLKLCEGLKVQEDKFVRFY